MSRNPLLLSGLLLQLLLLLLTDHPPSIFLFASPLSATPSPPPPPFSHDLLFDALTALLPNTTSTGGLSTLHDPTTGHFYHLATIQFAHSASGLDSSVPIRSHPNDTLQPDNNDLLLLRFAAPRTVLWAVRFGSPATDVPAQTTPLAHDAVTNALYVTFSTTTPLSHNVAHSPSGTIVAKFDTNGTRLWAVSYSTPRGRERFHAIVVPPASTHTVLVAGDALFTSPLIANSYGGVHNHAVLLAVAIVAVIDTRTGTLLATSRAPSNISDIPMRESSAVAAAVTVVAGTATLFVVGYALPQSTSSNADGDYYAESTVGMILSFSLSPLTAISAALYKPASRRATRNVEFRAVAPARNGLSVYAAGTTFLSSYEEHDALVARFNAKGRLRLGWELLLGSQVFSSSTTIRNGESEEHGRDVCVDEFGNVHVLVQSTARLAAFDSLPSSFANAGGSNTALVNKRPAVLTLAPNGTVVSAAQSLQVDTTIVSSLTVTPETILVSGYVFNRSMSIGHIFVSGVARHGATLSANGLEYVPSADDDLNDRESGDSTMLIPVATLSLWIVITLTVAGICMVILMTVALVSIVRRRIEHNRLVS